MKKLLLASLLGIVLSFSSCITPFFDPSAIKINKPVSMPLFYDNGGVRSIANDSTNDYIYNRYFANIKGVKASNLDSTWNYLSKSDAGRKKCRDDIKSNTKSGEIPAICFMISTEGCAGPLSGFPNVTDDQIAQAKAMIKEALEDGLAIFPCLYVDDPSGSIPVWTKIEQHMAVWTRIHNGIGRYVTGYALSIESNELANNAEQIRGCINVIRVAMPGVAFYGTHMMFGQTSSRYSWIGGSSTPSNADFILLEAPWHPNQGDAQGMSGIQNLYNTLKPKTGALKLIWHEYNLNPNGNMNHQQRDWLKTKGEWGVG
jgi:hypothetical protein